MLQDVKTLKKEAAYIINDINQYIKNFTSLTYFGESGAVFMKQECLGMLKYGYFDDSFPKDYQYIMYDTLSLAEFKKDFRVSKAVVTVSDSGVLINHEKDSKFENSNFEFFRVISPSVSAHDANIVHTKEEEIRREMYRNYDLSFYEKIHDVPNEWQPIDDDQLDKMEDSNLICLQSHYNGKTVRVYLTKVICPLIAKAKSARFRVIPYKNGMDSRVYYFQIEEYFEKIGLRVLTIIAGYQSI